MAEKVGCFVCTGCKIGDAVDIDQVLSVANESGAVVAKSHEALCSKEGLELINTEIESNGLNGVIVAACSQRDHVDTFRIPNVFVHRANLREQMAWTQPPGEEDTQMLAEDIIRMGFGKLQFTDVPQPEEVQVHNRILVVGGGVTGMSAALNAADAGKQVVIVEKQGELGGFANKLHKIFPKDMDLAAYPEPDLDALKDKVSNNENITVEFNSTVAGIAGAPAKFQVDLKNGSGQKTINVDSVVVAAGWTPYDATKLGHLGYGKPNVLTNVEFEQMAKEGKIARPSDGKEPESVLFVQCAGSRDDDHLPYCSNICCGATLKQITYLKDLNPEIATYVVYKDIRAPGHYEEVYRQVQKSNAVLIKGEIEAVEEGDDGKLNVQATDVLMGEPVFVEADMVVLATGMVPTTLEEDVLNLAYRQGPELPEREYGFPNSHFVCFPYETQRTAIYAAGAVRMPMDLATCIDDAAGAAAKAVQSINLIEHGLAVHPRVGDASLPDFNLSRCTQCKRCTEECPFGALNEDEKGTPQPNPTRCRRCGVCMGACPERIVEFPDYNIQMISQQIKNMFVPDEFEEKPRVVCMVCENDAMAAIDMAAQNGLKLNPFVRIIPLRCLGSFNIIWVADALSNGIDGVLLLGCKSGDDYQCHFIKGSELCETRMGNVQDTLDRLMLESERLRLEHIAITDYKKIPEIFDSFVERLEELGPNPYKD